MDREHDRSLPGSYRPRVEDATHIGAPDPDEHIEVTVILRRREAPPAAPSGQQQMSREAFAAQHGTQEDDVEAVRRFAEAHRLTVTVKNAGARSLSVSGRLADIADAFGTDLALYEKDGVSFRARAGELRIPADLADVIEGVFGLDTRPQAEPRIVFPLESGRGLSSFTPIQIANLYSFPNDLNGAGQAVGIIELGGGFINADLTTYFNGLGVPTPNVVAVGVDGGTNSPIGNPNSADAEVMLDIEVIGAIVPAADIVVYFAPNTTQGFIDAVAAAVHDTTWRPGVISISWGNSESRWTAMGMNSFESVLQDAAAMGVTVCAAAGDNGSTDGQGDGRQHADFPASAPHMLACGGTVLNSDGSSITSEVVWNTARGATGGGVSDVFPISEWQTGAGVPRSVNPEHFQGRGVPDLSGNAAPETGYAIRVDGTNATVGGTSAVSPLFSALVAQINQYLGGTTVGFLNPLLYTDAFVNDGRIDITSGNNGAYSAGTGWDACTGWGRPDGTVLLNAIATWLFARFEPSLLD